MTSQIAIVGTEGSGKTVLATVWAKKMFQQGDTYLYSKGFNTGIYVEKAWITLNNGEWLPSTSPGKKFELEWDLYIGHVAYPVKLLDVAGQDLRALFSNERRNDTNLSEHERSVLDYLTNSSIIVIVVNLDDFVGEPEVFKRVENELILKDIIDIYAADKQHQDIAVVFTAYDLYQAEMEEQHGCFEDYVKNKLRILWQAMRVGRQSGNMSIDLFPVAAVNKTEICPESRRRVPKPNFTSFGLEEFSDWVLTKVQQQIAIAASNQYVSNVFNGLIKETETSAVIHLPYEPHLKSVSMPKNPQAGDVWKFTMDGIEYSFHWCPSGKFMMGSPSSEENRRSNETQHQVTLSQGFWIQETEVMQQMWECVMGDNPSRFEGKQLPVECVSWYDCQKFISRLNALNISSFGYRFSLPTEAQWEYACRAESTTAYSFGDSWEQLENYAWYNNSSSGESNPVGQKKANSWGLYDMHGNVSEWCSDWYDDYPIKSVINPVGVSNGSTRVFRGGGWGIYARGCRSADRNDYAPTGRSDSLGLRLSLVGENK
ncbi:MAG: formylglycine-generating enzyme family protein [Planctomycetaceae bacterium]|jgi:formylglycine-generating enzyme required for sulfatase activity/GTPase SAR1 family protein|nr:formylglycine-generating enzyme family protein [Planctomycetaceae bacterium]